MRQKEMDCSMSIRLNKEEWNKIKESMDNFFKNRNVGYMQIIPGRVFPAEKSPYFKELESLDLTNKEKSDEDQKNHDEVLLKIKDKKVKT